MSHEMIHEVMLVGLVWSFGVGVLVLSCCFAHLSKHFINLCLLNVLYKVSVINIIIRPNH